MAAALAKGKTKLVNVAKEPEVVQLCEVLAKAGLDIKGIGTDELEIYGTDKELLDFKEFSVIPDRIEAELICVQELLQILKSHLKK